MEKFYLVAALLLTTVPAEAETRTLPLKGQTVVDGDTLKVGKERLRIIGYDCGEVRRPHYKCEAERQKGLEATARLDKQMSGSEGRVTVRRTPMRDGHGRPLTHAWVDGKHISKIMTSDGLCKSWDGEEARPNWCE